MRVRDIITEMINTDVRFKYLDDIEGDNNRGWCVDEVKAYLGDEKVGYLKIAYIPAERFKEWNPSILSFIQQVNGTIIFPHEYKKLNWKKVPINVLRNSVYNMAQVAGVGWNESNKLQDQAKTAIVANLFITRKYIITQC